MGKASTSRCSPSMIASVSLVEPSSEMISSSGGVVCAHTVAIVSPMKGAESYVGQTTEMPPPLGRRG
jgi:hypothetical protein